MKRALRLPFAIAAILLFGIVGAVLFRVAASGKPHSVVLNWNPPAPRPGVTVTSYRIYRTQPDGSFGPIASVTAPTYVDRKVISGTTYRYYVIAIDSAGHESPPSNQASAAVP